MTAPTHDQPLVTVLIACYNHAAYVEASIMSVLNQTYPNIELLVIDDGSQDDSVTVLSALQARHGFDLQVQENQGLSRTLNAGIARARGTLIVPFGSDDIMLPHRIATQVSYLAEKPEVGACSANVETIDHHGQVMGAREQRHRDLPFRRLEFDDLFLGRKPGPSAATLMFRREALQRVGGFNPEIRLEDIYITLAILRAGYYIDVLGEVLAQYRDHPTNTFKNGRFMIDNVLRTYAEFSDHPDYERVCMRFRNSMFLKFAKNNKPLARETLKQIPLRHWNRKTVRGLFRLLAPRPPQHPS
ncbi:glycosyltransferase family 2 protein [Pseudomonas eucalypticola]|uniref:Glycosyltransferase n=1 Tax=Pseudomonas eucalypticola TaxID=2599595 RepID=A0A7D5D4E3_9PSED|nr:glycosyltransferase [Pseudomonas eucalypticola]QKZ02739.1 glycosyltransferase [Pseudomonas eucalypticola]